MRQRPIGQLLEMLRALGVQVDELGSPGRVPIRVHPCRVRGGTLSVPTTLSSQYISAVMMLALNTAEGITFQFDGPVTSPAYIEMTASLMWSVCGPGFFYPEGNIGEGRLRIPPKPEFTMSVLRIEPDASGATYFWGAASVVNGAQCVVSGLRAQSLQGDSRFVQLLARFGATYSESDRGGDRITGSESVKGIEADLANMPDAAMTAAAVACFATGTTELRGLRTLRVKETDRLAAMETELSKLGVRVEIESYTNKDGVKDELIRITPPAGGGGIDCSSAAPRVVFDTYDDHRMAMSLAIIGLRRPNVVIRDPACVAKTYPTFWNDWARLYCGK